MKRIHFLSLIPAMFLLFSVNAIAGQLQDKLFDAAGKDGDLATVKALLAKGADVNAKDKYGNTALMHAAAFDHLDIARLLITKGADVNARSAPYYYTALEWAAFGGHADIVRLLLEKGADINARDKNLETPLYQGVTKNHADVVMLLLKKGADLDFINKDGDTALVNAVAAGHTDIAQILVEGGADVNLPGRDNLQRWSGRQLMGTPVWLNCL